MKLLGISGSLRKDSAHTMLMKAAFDTGIFDETQTADINFPLFNEDIETASGEPAAVTTVVEQLNWADAVFVASPEYNKNISGALKNALDWISRSKSTTWAGKPVAVGSAAASRSGGERGQNSFRLCMQPFNPRLLYGPELLVAGANAAFDEQGNLMDERSQKALENLLNALKAEVELIA